MKKQLLSAMLVVGPACSTVTKMSPDAAPHPDTPPLIDAATMTCDWQTPFAAPVAVDGLPANSRTWLSDDETTAFYEFSGVVFEAHRQDASSPFAAAIAHDELGPDAVDPTLDAAGLTIVFTSGRAAPGSHLFAATRATTTASFGAPQLLDAATPASSTFDVWAPSFAAGRATLWFATNRTGGDGGLDIWRASVSNGSFGTSNDELSLASDVDDSHPVLTSDGLTMYFASHRGVASANDYQVFVAHRVDVRDGFGVAQSVPQLNSGTYDFPVWISPDGCRLYTSSLRSGNQLTYVATRTH